MSEVEPAALASDVEALELELSGLRERVERDTSSFSTLESQIAALRARLAQTQENVRIHELLLAEKHVELAEARRVERLGAYEEHLGRHGDAQSRVADAASAFLAELDSYDGEAVDLRKLLEEMRVAFGSDQRVAQVEAALAAEPEELTGSWKAVVEAVKWRMKPDAAAPTNGDDLSKELQGRAEERRRSRIMEYFTKS